MYREKLISQIEVFENAQKICCITDIPELVELSDNILKLAKKVDELDEKSNGDKPSQIFSEAVRQEIAKSMKEAADRHKNDKHCFG